MHSRSRRFVAVATLGLTAALAACSSSTSPKPLTPQQVAAHFDSMYASLLSQGTSMDSGKAEFIADYLEMPPAFGAQDGAVTVTTASGPSTWKGYTFEGATTGDGGDSVFYAVAFSDLNLSQVVIAEMEFNSSGILSAGGAIAVVGLENGGSTTLTSGSVSVASTGSACSEQAGLAAEMAIAEWVGPDYTCQFATFGISFSATFSPSDSVGSLVSVSVSNATFDGLRFSAAEGPSHVAPIPSKLAALGLRLRTLPFLHRQR